MEKSTLPILNVTEDIRRIIMPLRLMLSLTALAIAASNTQGTSQQQWLIIGTLLVHAIYSSGLYLLMLHSGLQLPFRIVAWLDVAWAMLLVVLSSDVESIFFPFILFAILSSAFCGGIRTGIQITIVSAGLFVLASAISSMFGATPEPNRVLLLAVVILLSGYMASYCGGSALLYKRRLVLLREVTKVSNPRFGVEHVISSIMNRLSALYDSHSCLFITSKEETAPYTLRRVDSQRIYSMDRSNGDFELLRQLMEFPSSHAVVYSRRSLSRCLLPNHFAFDVATGQRAEQDQQLAENIADLLDVESFISVPLRRHNEVMGRIFLTFERRYAVEPADIDFILHVCEHAITMLDYIRLVEQLATSAAEDERNRIALDIHDSLIQPYIGLQIGLEAVRQRLLGRDSAADTNGRHGYNRANNVNGEIAANGTDIKNGMAADGLAPVYEDIVRLCDLAESGVAELRQYVNGLKGGGESDDKFVPAVRRYARKMQDATGIIIEVKAEDIIDISGRLAAETFQMICEGLSNVRRHTHSQRATISLAASHEKLSLSIENEGDPVEDSAVPPFTPRSISERARALGGTVDIERHRGRGNAVHIQIPL